MAAESAKLGLTETSLGSIPGSCGTLRLPRLIGLGYAKEMLATAEKMPAARAAEIGLVNHVVPDDELMEYTLALAERIACNCNRHRKTPDDRWTGDGYPQGNGIRNLDDWR
jgi:enoyl-CoA hydratase/carnithine racemase